MSDPTKQTKIGEQPDDNIAKVTKLVLDLVNAPAYALFMVYKNFKRDYDLIVDSTKAYLATENLRCILKILKTVLALQGVDADSEKL